jgi:hypothetical protein
MTENINRESDIKIYKNEPYDSDVNICKYPLTHVYNKILDNKMY